MSKKYWDIKNKLTNQDYARLSIWRHPHRQSLKYYAHKVGLVRKPTQTETVWLNKNTTGKYSVDNTIAPHNISFEVRRDAMYFKLVWFGTLACQPHI